MTKVTIKRILVDFGDNGYNPIDDIEVLVDEKPIGRGSFGGEPEDNSKHRDYNWVEPLLAKLAETLGAEVEFEDVVEMP